MEFYQQEMVGYELALVKLEAEKHKELYLMGLETADEAGIKPVD